MSSAMDMADNVYKKSNAPPVNMDGVTWHDIGMMTRRGGKICAGGSAWHRAVPVTEDAQTQRVETSSCHCQWENYMSQMKYLTTMMKTSESWESKVLGYLTWISRRCTPTFKIMIIQSKAFWEWWIWRFVTLLRSMIYPVRTAGALFIRCYAASKRLLLWSRNNVPQSDSERMINASHKCSWEKRSNVLL